MMWGKIRTRTGVAILILGLVLPAAGLPAYGLKERGNRRCPPTAVQQRSGGLVGQRAAASGCEFPSRSCDTMVLRGGMLRGGAGEGRSGGEWSRGTLWLIVGNSMCGLLRGFDTGIIAGALLLISSAFHLEDSPKDQGVIATSATVGAVVGTVIAGKVADLVGRKRTLLLGALLSFIGSCVCTTAPSLWALLVGRVVSGIAFGFYSTAVNVHLAECAAPAHRGALLTLPQVAVSTGIALSYLYAVIVILAGGGFRAMLGASSAMSVAVAVSVALMPESPRWLLQCGRRDCAKRALCELRGGMTKEVQREWAELDADHRRAEAAPARGAAAPGKGGWGLGALLRERSVVRSLAVCCVLQALQQLSGINAIIYFTPQVLGEVGAGSMFERWYPSLKDHPSAGSLLATLASYLPKLPAILVSMYLVDRIGRRLLLLAVLPLLALSLAALAASLSLPLACWYRSHMAILSLGVYGIFFVLSLGPMPNMITGELLPTYARGAGMSVSVGVQWVFSSLVSLSFPLLRSAIGTAPALLSYAAVMAGGWVFILLCLPETAGVSLEALHRQEKDKDRQRDAK